MYAVTITDAMPKAPIVAVSATDVSAPLITAHPTKSPQKIRLPKTARRRSFQLGRLGLVCVIFDVAVELVFDRFELRCNVTLPPL